jgi:hypothetical protein
MIGSHGSALPYFRKVVPPLHKTTESCNLAGTHIDFYLVVVLSWFNVSSGGCSACVEGEGVLHVHSLQGVVARAW